MEDEHLWIERNSEFVLAENMTFFRETSTHIGRNRIRQKKLNTSETPFVGAPSREVDTRYREFLRRRGPEDYLLCAILDKLRPSDRTQATLFAVKRGLS